MGNRQPQEETVMTMQKWETDSLWSPDDELELEDKVRRMHELDDNMPPDFDDEEHT